MQVQLILSVYKELAWELGPNNLQGLVEEGCVSAECLSLLTKSIEQEL